MSWRRVARRARMTLYWRMLRSVPAVIFAVMLFSVIGCRKLGAEGPENGESDRTVSPRDAMEKCLRQIRGSLTATPTRTIAGRSTTLQWSTQGPAICKTFGAHYLIHNATINETVAVPPSGNRPFDALFATRYQLVAQIGAARVKVAEAIVTVKLPRTVHIRGSTKGWRQLLVWAVRTRGTVVRLAPNVDMDLTGALELHANMEDDPTAFVHTAVLETIYFGRGVTLTGDQVPGEVLEQLPSGGTSSGGGVANPGGTAPPSSHFGAVVPGRGGLRLGPRLFRTRKTGSAGQLGIKCNPAAFLDADDVKISGFRLIGPIYASTSGVSAVGIGVESCRRVEISNMEVAGWSNTAIQGGDDLDRIKDPEGPSWQMDPNSLLVRENYLHHNQHAQLGYGTNVGGQYGRILHNVFDSNRHAIAGGAGAGSGYVASRNLILKGGGQHFWFVTYVNTHQIDVHGDDDCGFGSHNCGNAGTFWRIIDNASQYAIHNNVEIRGTPRIRAEINGNVFPRGFGDELVLPIDPANIWADANEFNVDSYGHYEVCDFDGDGHDDLFLPTRRTWWYSSGAKMNWVWLRDATEELPVLGFGYFDGDRKCDVIRRAADGSPKLQISSGGRAEWTDLPGDYSMPFKELRFVDYDGDGTTDIFTKTARNIWAVTAPNPQAWRPLAASGAPMTELKFANLSAIPTNPHVITVDNVRDVLRIAHGQIHVSRDGLDPWAPLTLPYADGDKIYVGDLDASGHDDIIKYQSATRRWFVAWMGQKPWKPLDALGSDPARGVIGTDRRLTWIGRFNGTRASELLFVDGDRLGHLYAHPTNRVARYSLYQY